MVKNTDRIRYNMAYSIIAAIIVLLGVFGSIVCMIGFHTFSDSFKREYAETTYHMADTATTLINGDHLEAYLAGEETEEYERSRKYLDGYCRRMNVTMIYVILVDRSDYGRFVSVFNPVNNEMDNSSYTEWEPGHRRETTNDEYRQKYQAIYEQKVPYETVYRILTTDGQHPHITTMVPVKNSSGEVAAILCMQRPFRELRDVNRIYLRHILVSAFFLTIISIALACYFFRKRVVDPIRTVSEEAGRFARENTKGEELGHISNYSEIDNLANSIDKMETDMVKYMENLTAVTAEKERIGAELSLARTIQLTSVPNEFPPFPDRKDFDIFASMTPAKEVGGDFYNFLFIDQDHLALVIGDVSGKGVPAALFMMATNILISNGVKMGGNPADVLTYINHDICGHNEAEMFITIWLGILELSTGRIVAANAGHEDPAICRRGGSFELFRTKHNLAVGVMDGIVYRNVEMQLGKGDKLFVYTDGVPEATDKNDKLFTLGRMIDTLNKHKEQTPEQILTGIHEGVKAFVGDTPQFDDLTMLCLELTEGPQDARDS